MARVVNAFGLVLLLVFSTFVLLSLLPYRGGAAVLTTIVTALTGVVSLASARARPDILRWGSRLAIVAILASIAGGLSGEQWCLGLAGFVNVVVLLAGALAVLRAVVTEERIGFRTILGAVSVYVTLGLLFGFLYLAIDKVTGRPFFGSGVHVAAGDYVFFSMTTLTTTGYGDLVPAFQPGKMFAVLEMLTGQIFLVTLIARLVSQWQPGAWLRHGAGIAQDFGDEET